MLGSCVTAYIAFGGLVGGAVALLGCSSTSGRETGLRTITDQNGPELPEDGNAAQPSHTDVSGTDVEPPGVDDSALDGCAASADFVPLGAIPERYLAYWKILDPRGGYVYWAHEYSGSDVRIDNYRWSASGGIEQLNELLQPPAAAYETQARVNYVSLDGRVFAGLRWSDDITVQEFFRYTPETGAVASDLDPPTLSGDGKVVFGLRDGRPMRWTESGGMTELALPSEMRDWYFPPAQFWSSETGDTLLGVGLSADTGPHVVRWTAAAGWVDLGLLPAGAGAPDSIPLTVSAAGDAIVGTLGNPAGGGSRVFRWTEASGSTDLGALAGLPAEASYEVTHLSADGSVVVGAVQLPGEFTSRVFRWTETLGMQDLMSDSEYLYPSYMSVQGDAVIAQGAGASELRWTQAGGVESLDMDVRAASADGNLLAGARGFDPVFLAVGAEDSAAPSLAELAPPTIVPPDWTDALIGGISADGQLLVGTATNPQGLPEAWLLRRTERCPAR